MPSLTRNGRYQKVSVSLTPDDLIVLDEYARRHAISSRSAALRRLIKLGFRFEQQLDKLAEAVA